MPVTAADMAIPEEETPVASMYAAAEPSGDEEDTTAQDVAAADDLPADEPPEGGDTAIPEGGASSEDAKITRVADNGPQRPPAPSFVPYLPGMSDAQKKIVDHINNRIQQKYTSTVDEYKLNRRAAESRANLEYRMGESRKTREELQRNSQMFQLYRDKQRTSDIAAQSEKQHAGVVEENKRKEQAAFEKTPDGRFEKGMRKAWEGKINPDGVYDKSANEQADAQRLDAGVRYHDEMNKKLDDANPNTRDPYYGNEARVASGKTDRYGTIDKARADDESIADQDKNAAYTRLNDAQKRELYPLIDGIMQHNDSDPRLIYNAVHEMAYGVNTPIQVDIKRGAVIVGDPKVSTPVTLYMTSEQFNALRGINERVKDKIWKELQARKAAGDR